MEMRRKISLLLVVCLLFSIVFFESNTYAEDQGSQIVTIPDANLEMAIRKQLNKMQGDITVEDMESLQFLYASNREISNLEGLQYAVNLIVLLLPGNNIHDVSLLMGLDNLIEINVSYNRLDLNDEQTSQCIDHLKNKISEGNFKYLPQKKDISNLPDIKEALIVSFGEGYFNVKVDKQKLPEELRNFAKIGVCGIDEIPSSSRLEDIVADGEFYKYGIMDYSDEGFYSGNNILYNIVFLFDDEYNTLGYGVLDMETERANYIEALNQIINIPDENLKEAIRQALNKPEGDITVGDMIQLHYVDASFRNVANLEGLQYAQNLKFLNLWWNNIEDISIVSSLTNLEWINLANNNISDITALSSLKKLVSLDLWSNNIENISSISNLINLQWLSLGYNKISDISPISNSKNLKELYINNNRITDIQPVEGLYDNLEKLNIFNNFINLSEQNTQQIINNLKNKLGDNFKYLPQNKLPEWDMDEIVNIPDKNLEAAIREELNIPVRDITAGDMLQLTFLSACGKNISNLEGLQYALNLSSLYLHNNNISNNEHISELTNLQWLGLEGNNITDISALKDLKNLKGLSLEFNNIRNIEHLINLDQLEELYIRYNKLNLNDEQTNQYISYLNNKLSEENFLYLPQKKDISNLADIKGAVKVSFGDGYFNVKIDKEKLSEEIRNFAKIGVGGLDEIVSNDSLENIVGYRELYQYGIIDYDEEGFYSSNDTLYNIVFIYDDDYNTLGYAILDMEDERTPCLTISEEENGGAGKYRTINIQGHILDENPKYLTVQLTEGTGEDAKVSVITTTANCNEINVSYKNAGTKVEVWLTDGMPDLTGNDIGTKVYAYASTDLQAGGNINE